MTYQRLRMAVRLLTCFLMLMAMAVQRNGSIFGHEITAPVESDLSEAPAITEEADGFTVNTSSIASDIKGYGGPVPLEISVKDGKISDITPLRNAETESFFSRVRQELLPRWIGTPVDSVASKAVDGVTGATFSSRAVNATVKAGIAYAESNGALSRHASAATGFDWSLRSVAVLVVVLCAAILPLFIRDRRYRYVQLALNVIVLGFWSGTFLCYEVFVSYIANGANILQSLVILLMMVIAFIYPYFGRKSHYCLWVCPLGSIQELAGRCSRRKLPMSPRLVKALTTFQEALWVVLMLVMCAGLWFEWMGWELFTAFIFKHAAIGVIIAAILFVALSVVVNRPYCRFVCPTGCLFQVTQDPDKLTTRR